MKFLPVSENATCREPIGNYAAPHAGDLQYGYADGVAGGSSSYGVPGQNWSGSGSRPYGFRKECGTRRPLPTDPWMLS